MSELPIKATLKAGGGYDAPWLTMDASDPNDLAFKLKGLIEHESALTLVIEAANALKAHNTAAPIAASQALVPPTSQPAAPQQQAQQPWGQTPAAQQQGAAPAQQHRGGQRFNDVQHPEGKGCETCPEILVLKKSQGGKEKWQCPAWRWNNGTPNGHSMEWIN